MSVALGAAAAAGGTADGGNSGSTSGGGAGAGAGASTGGSAGGSGAGTGDGSGNAGASGAGANGGLGDDGKGGAANWRDTLPDDLKNDPTLNKYSDLPNLAKAHIELQKKIGEKGIFKPKPGASAEEIKAFREALGVPTDAAKYELALDDKAGFSPEIVAWAKEQGAKRGIDPSEMKGFMEDYAKMQINTDGVKKAAAQEEMKKGLDGLRTEWGDGFDRNLQRANFAAEKIGGKALVERLVKYGAHNDPTILKAFAEAAKLYGEDRLREGGVGDGRPTPAELDGKIAQVQARLFSMKKDDGAYLAVKQEYESLWKQKTGGR